MATAKDNRSRLSISQSAQQCSNTTPHTEDPHCEQVIGSSQPPVRSRVQSLHTQQELSELLIKQLNEVISLLKAGNTKQALQRQEDKARLQQRRPLLPPQPRPTHLPIPQPPSQLHKLSTPLPSSSLTISHDTSDQSCDDPRCSIITVSSGYGSLTRSTGDRQSFMNFYDQYNKDDDINCDLPSSEELDYTTPPTPPC